MRYSSHRVSFFWELTHRFLVQQSLVHLHLILFHCIQLMVFLYCLQSLLQHKPQIQRESFSIAFNLSRSTNHKFSEKSFCIAFNLSCTNHKLAQRQTRERERVLGFRARVEREREKLDHPVLFYEGDEGDELEVFVDLILVISELGHVDPTHRHQVQVALVPATLDKRQGFPQSLLQKL